MDITKLTIQGFKSFYEKSVFTFDKNITAIVGPNGSGKSNITEGVRFVLGEQSAKSMRGKDATDLLYRGNSTKATKASVQIEFKKSEVGRSIQERGGMDNIFIKNALEKDVVTISRTIYADGKSIYEMNGVEVRLKDVHEFLLYVHLGNKSSWHISQGEADRVLLANPQERKSLIEDALGLKVYHSRINDSIKKLDKTKENIREATFKRKEIVPELAQLSKQVEKIRRSNEFRTDLTDKAQLYLKYKNFNISNLKQNGIQENLEELDHKIRTLQQDISEKEKSLYKEGGHDTVFLEQELGKEERVLNILQEERRELEDKKRNIVNNLEYLKLEEEKNTSEVLKIEQDIKEVSNSGNDVIFSERDVNSTRDSIETITEKIGSSSDLNEVKNLSHEVDFTYKKLISTGTVVNKDNVKQISYLQSIKTRLQEKLQQIKVERKEHEDKQSGILPGIENNELKLKLSTERVEMLRKQILEFKFQRVETEREIQKFINELNALQIKLSKKVENESKISELEREFSYELEEFKNILGKGFVVDTNSHSTTEISHEELNTLKRSIERLKIRLEESMVANPDEVVKSFEDMTERDNFLIKEIGDLENSMKNLEVLIADLKENLKKEFELGLTHINNVFDSYVKKLFGGGGAKVFVVELEGRKKTGLTEDGEEEVEQEDQVKTGVDVEVEIPKKKVKGLHSLSGGERALVSIALNFSIINQNPSPFMILDETDATLDEANAKRYGEILEMLKKNTKLIVVTHNRETMHFADQVYGVTLSKDGYSKVLSVSFEDAIEYAK